MYEACQHIDIYPHIDIYHLEDLAVETAILKHTNITYFYRIF